MTFNQLARRLRREATANPKKAALLGVALVVAVYFWTPLVSGWLFKKAPPAPGRASPVAGKADPSASLNGSVAKASATAVPTASPAVHRSWNQLAAWIASDARMKPIGPLSAERDPFDAGKHKKGQGWDDEPPEATPESLGMVLTGTVVGPRSCAVLGGRSVEVGAMVEYGKGGQVYRFQLVEVHPRRVVLERAGIRYSLAIASSRTTRIELAGGSD